MKRKVITSLFALVLVVGLSLMPAVPVAAATINVDDAMSTTAINEAIASAGTGDVVKFADGTYTLTEKLVVGVAGVTLEGNIANPQLVTIDGGDTLFVPALEITAAGVTLKGFTIQNFKANAAHDFAAVFVNQGDGATIQGNTILNITCDDPLNAPFGIGIDVAANNVDVIGNTVHDVHSIGIRVYGPGTETTGVLVENNEVYQTGNTGVVFANAVVNSTIRGNTLYDSADPTPYNLLICWGFDKLAAPSGITIEGNTIYGGYGNVVLAGAESIEIKGNTITGAVEIPSFAKGKNIYILDDYLQETHYLSTNIVITNNDITGADGYGVRIKYTGGVPEDGALMASTTHINNNNISGNTEYGVENTIETEVDATSNWWGHAEGPTHVSNPSGEGDVVSDFVDYTGFLPQALRSVEMTATSSLAEPPTVTTSAASDVAFTLATLNGNLTDMGTADSVYVSFEYGITQGALDLFTTPVPVSITGEFSASIDTLASGTTYYFRAKAQGNDVALPVFGDELSFTTAAVTTLAATHIGAYTATLNGHLDIGSATSVDVSFEYGETMAYGLTAPATPATMTESGDFSADLTELTLPATYHFQALGDIGGDMGYGGDMQFTTAPRIGISVSPTWIDFGDIIAGHSSDTMTVTVTNTGDYLQIFTASLEDEVPDGFYTANLAIDDGTVAAWITGEVLSTEFVTPELVLSIPIGADVGAKTATLIFWAEAAPY